MKSNIAQGLFSLLSPAGSGGRLSILLFHKIPTVADPLTTGEIDLSRFEHILDFLTDNAHVMPLQDATAALQASKLPKGAMALTFDDGYAEWIENVSPALRRRNLPATFFVTTGHLDGSALWHERIIAAVRALPDRGFTLPYGFGKYTDLGLPGTRLLLVRDLQARLKYLHLAERVSAIEILEAQAHSAIALPHLFDKASVRTLHSQGFDIGAHTVHHPILTKSTVRQARAEIGACKEELQAIIGARIHSFAYPNGRPNEDYGQEHVEMVKSLGYTLAVTTSNGAATRSADIFQLPRFTPWGLSDERMALQLGRNMRTRPLTAATQRSNGSHSINVRCLLIASDKINAGMPLGYMRVPAHAAKCTVVNFPLERIDLARLRMKALRRLPYDILAYSKVLVSAARAMRMHAINVVCIDELTAGGWLGRTLKKLYPIKLIVMVRSADIASSAYVGKRAVYLGAADRIVTIDKATFDTLTGKMQVDPKSIVLIQQGDKDVPSINELFLKMCMRLLSEDRR